MSWKSRFFLFAPLAGLLAASGIVGARQVAPQLAQVVIPDPASSTITIPANPVPAPFPSPAQPPELTQFTYSPFPSFNSEQFDRQVQLYLNYLAEQGTPDILIVGSSRALQGVDPLVLQETLAKRGYPNLKIFNLSLNGGTAQTTDWTLRHLVAPNQLPRLIIWADGSRAFNNGRIDHTYQKIINSPGHQQLLAGVRPRVPEINAFDLKQICIDMPPSYTTIQPQVRIKRVAPGNSVAPQPANNLLCSTTLRNLIRPQTIAASAAEKANDEKVNLELAHAKTAQALKPKSYLEALGFQIVSGRFNPETYFQRYPRVAGRYDGDYRNFNLNGQQTTVALKNVIRFAELHKIPLTYVNLPLHRIYLDGVRSDYEWRFRAYMRNVARSSSLIFHDLGDRWVDRNDFFLDPSHLNRYGAAAVARQIGQTLTIPWVSPVQPPQK
ncbi:hypothetical protein ACN4EK_04950 [Pantanalinema rosaneae CENA516]|uniref:hypothetical protein n=1 Tax=Pantanalinema rosaneae TaxID=1620701 RepID=UPI003D6DBEEB